MSGLRRLAVLLTVLAMPSLALAGERYAILVGANPGWATDRPLQYASKDAARLAAVLKEYGGFAEKDVLLLDDPSTEELRRHFEALAQQAKGKPDSDGLFVFYYSGHADPAHLHLRGNPLSMSELYDTLRALPHKVKLGVLDACQSGSIVNLKGGKKTTLFEVNVQDELAVRGLAVLTSSGADELSQETKAIQGSVFTHHLVSGLRGAADENTDKKISVSEAYRYASERTYLDTVASPAGPQRPAFKFDLTGQGDVFLTHLQQNTGRIQFAAKSPNCFLTDSQSKGVVAEVAGGVERIQELLVPPASYLLKCRRTSDFAVAALTVEAGKPVSTSRLSFKSAPLSEGVLKGSVDPQTLELRRKAYLALEEGNYQEAVDIFDQLVSNNFGDTQAFRGKAQALLLRSKALSDAGDVEQAESAFAAALKNEPQLRYDPFVESRRRRAAEEKEQPPPRIQPPPGQPAPPLGPTYQPRGLGVGLSLLDGNGLLVLSGRWLVVDHLELGLHLTPFNPGAGLGVRWLPIRAKANAYVGVGGHLSLVGAGLAERTSDAPFRFDETTLATQSQFDRNAYAEVGLELDLHPLYFDLGVSMVYAAPPRGQANFLVMPVLSGKWFL